MDEKQNAFQIDLADNVATALTPLVPGPVELRGDACAPEVQATTEGPGGHKIALRDICKGEDIVKYGVVIGRATTDIPAGSWVHLHVMCSVYDQRSSHLDVKTGAPKDTKYE